MSKHKFSRRFYIICFVLLLASVIVERITPHMAYGGFYEERAQRASEDFDFDRAQVNYSAAIHADPLRVGFYYRWGESLKERGDYRGAIPYLQEATYLDTTRKQVYFESLGFCYFQLGYYDRARVSFSEAIIIQPDFNHCRYYLILTLLKLGEREKALYHFQKLKHYRGVGYAQRLEPLLNQF